jgi:hypothetical protein
MLMMGSSYILRKAVFENSRKLTLKELKKLKMVEIDKRSMSGLEQLEIGPCL